MSTVESYLTQSIKRQPPVAPQQSVASQIQTATNTDLVDLADETTLELIVEVATASDHGIHWAPFHRLATLASLALCAAALWGLAWQSAQIARLNLADSRLLTQVGVTQSANLGLQDEITHLTNTTRIFRIARALHMHPSGVLQVPVHS